jgi:hypothetical protein
MTRQFDIISPTKTISLIDTGDEGIIAERGGFGQVKLFPHQFDEGRDIDDLLVVERWKLNIRAYTHNEIASRSRDLMEVLREAWKYHQNPRDTQPVYIRQQTTDESNPRYALVYKSPDVSNPDFFSPPFDPGNLIEGSAVSVARFAWEDGVPGDIPATALVLDTAPDGGPASPLIVPISNTEDGVGALTHVYRDDGGVFSSNLVATSAHDYFPAAPAVTDAYYIGSTNEPMTSVVLNVGTIFAGTALVGVWEYYNGAWVTLPVGTNLMASRSPDWFNYLGEHILGLHMEDWTQTTINTVNAWWIRYRLTTVTAVSTVPANSSFIPYVCGHNYISIPSAGIRGDISPQILMSIVAPWSAITANPDLATINKIIVGAKSRNLDNFVSVINLNDVAVGGWTHTNGTDAAIVDTGDSEGSKNRYTNVTFAGTESLDMRLRMTLAAPGIKYYQGEYKMFLRCQQIGGAVGDCTVGVKTRLWANTDLFPQVGSGYKALRAIDAGPEIVDLGTIQIPFAPQAGDLNDSTFLNGPLYFEVEASVVSGSAGVLRLYDIILIPIDEWTAEYVDPLDDLTYGSSALRRFGGLLDDSGIIYNGTWRWQNNSGLYYPWGIRERWIRGGKPPMLDPVRGQTRWYFLLMHHDQSGWGTPPYFAEWGMSVMVQLYTRNRYLFLRGSD